MSILAEGEPNPAPHRDHGFHPLRVKRVVRETADASSFVFEVPAELVDAFSYEPGQFLTFRTEIDGETYLRCYSMCSAPAVGDELQVTVKRVPGGVVSNWMNDALVAGDVIDATLPAGVFNLQAERDVVAFAGGSGITPVFSILKTALATTSRRVHLLYANRDRESVIFATELDELTSRYSDRLLVTHHLDIEDGYVDDAEIGPFVKLSADADFYICGPGPFMDVVERTLLDGAVDSERIHIERFTPPETIVPDEVADQAPDAVQVTIELDRRTEVAEYRHGSTILQTARQVGMRPPFSCESGTCATCMAKIVEGAAMMRNNSALTEDEVADGWVLTCQAVPTTPTVHVIYGID